MRKITYEISNNSTRIVTTSLQRAREVSAEMGIPYKTYLADVVEKTPIKSPKRQAMVDKFGRVSPKFKNEV